MTQLRSIDETLVENIRGKVPQMWQRNIQFRGTSPFLCHDVRTSDRLRKTEWGEACRCADIVEKASQLLFSYVSPVKEVGHTGTFIVSERDRARVRSIDRSEKSVVEY